MPTGVWGKLAISVLVAVMSIAGCMGDPEGQKSPESKAPIAPSSPEQKPAPQPPTQSGGDSAGQGAPVAQTEFVLYFANANADKLVPVKRFIPRTEAPARAAVEALIAGPTAKEQALPVMPKGTRLLDINLSQGNVLVNFSKEFRENHPGGSAGEMLTLYALANTLTEFPQIKTVRIWVEGKELQSYIHMDLRNGLRRRPDLIAPKS